MFDEQTKITDRDGRRIRFYTRTDVSKPGQQERRAMRAKGLSWCRGCQNWLAIGVVKSGSCRPCQNANDRARFAANPDYRLRRQIHRSARRGVEAVPAIGRECLTEHFGGECAYCPAEATTWDHFVPVSKGGVTVAGNILPACSPCNSRKKASDPMVWLETAAIKVDAVEFLVSIGAL